MSLPLFLAKIRRSLSMVAALALLGASQFAAAQDAVVGDNRLPPSQDPARRANGLAMTPPMGWNSWNKFGCSIDEKTVRAMADAMVANGMKQAGYQYVVIDDCWHGRRDKDGFITANATKFPSGIKALSDYVHSRGLKFGIYSDAGALTCGKQPGSQGHEYQDALTYARWGVDYLKYDWCSTGTRNAEEAYALMADAITASRRPMLLSICEWGTSKPWQWAPKIGNMWRTTGDIRDSWNQPKTYSLGMLQIADLNEPLWPFAGPGHWNDPDMLEVGNGGMTDSEYRAHFSLWAMMAAPLIAGNDIAEMSDATREILLNQEVIAIDQDALGQQGRRVRDDGDQEVWVRPLADGGRAVLFLNRGNAPAMIAVDWRELGYPVTLSASVRDLWAHRSTDRVEGRHQVRVPSHAAVMIRILPRGA